MKYLSIGNQMAKIQVIPTVYILLLRATKVLLSMRHNTGFHDGEYSLPAGHVEQAETLIQAAAREAKEELGMNLEPGDFQLVHVMHRRGSEDNRVNFFFLCEKWTSEPTNTEPEKCSRLDWFEVDALPHNIIGYVEQAIKHSIGHCMYSEYGWGP